MTDEMRAFLTELAEVLSKHDASIHAYAQWDSSLIEFSVSGGPDCDMESGWVDADDLRKLLEKGK